MEVTADESNFPVDLEGSLDPRLLPEITFRNDMMQTSGRDQNSPSHMVSKSNSGRLSPVRGRTIKEYDQQISDLKKENFSLKMRIYYLEERMEQRYGDGQDVVKTNIELQVEVEKLKKDVAERQVLLQRAAMAMDTLKDNHKQAEESMKSRVLSEFQDEIKRLQALAEDAQKECEKYRQSSEEAEKKLNALQQDLNRVKTDLGISNREKDDLSDKLKNAEFDVQHLTAQLRLTEQVKSEKERENGSLSQRLKDLDNQLHDSQKEIVRRDRDLQNLSVLLQDQSNVDSTSILEPVHKQDEIDDAKTTIKRQDDKIGTLEDCMKQKENMLGRLEDALKEMEQKLKESETGRESTEKELGKSQGTLLKYKKSWEQTLQASLSKEKELKNSEKKLAAAMDTIKSLEKSLQDAELEKTKTLGDLTKELTDLEVDSRRLRLQLAQAERTAEGLAMSLGKKEGELAGFQDQLRRATEALRKSDDALEALQNQLMAERAEFDKKMREQALKHQENVDGKTGLGQGIEKVLDVDKVGETEALKQSRDMAALERELQALKAELQGKNLKIQAVENPRIYIESHHETVHHFIDRTDPREVPVVLLTDLKNLLEKLTKEMTSLSGLQQLLFGMSKSGDTASSAELLLTEISSVQRIYKQLEGGVEKNNQLHQALLCPLRGERRQSDSPDSSTSCQDGGYNLAPLGQQQQQPRLDETARTPGKQHISSTTGGGTSVGVGTGPGLVDRSFQTGSPLSHADQWVQTSPGPATTVDFGTSINLDTRHTVGKDSPHAGQRQYKNFQPSSLLKSPRTDSKSDTPARHSHVHFADNVVDVRHASLTDDAKGVSPLTSTHNADHPSSDYFNFHHSPLFGEDNFDVRAHDRASSGRNTLTHNDSENAAIPSSTASSGPTSSACSANASPIKESDISAGLHVSPKSRGQGDLSKISTKDYSDRSVTKSPAEKNSYISPKNRNGNTSARNDHFGDKYEIQTVNHNDVCSPAGDIIDFNNHRSASFVSPGSKGGSVTQVNGRSPVSRKEDSLLGKGDGAAEARTGEIRTETGSDIWPEERGDQRSRRSSWAEELEQYRVHGEDSSDQQNVSKDHLPGGQKEQKQADKPQHQVIVNMSAVELRDLVAQLQVDLVDAIKENKALQEELRASSAKKPTVNGIASGRSTMFAKSKIPRLQASSSCHSTTSEDSDWVDSARSQGSKRDLFNSKDLDQSQPVNSHASRAEGSRNVSADQAVSTTLQSKLNESHAMIKNLQNKLQATENTVRLLSKKNKTYISALESAGLSASVLNRSNSESCLASFTEAPNHKTGSMTSLSMTDASRRLAHLLSPMRDRDISWREKSRAVNASQTSVDPYKLNSSTPPALARSPASSTATNFSPTRNTDSSACSSLHQTQSATNAADISKPLNNFKVPAIPSPPFKPSVNGSSPPSKADCSSNGHIAPATNRSQQSYNEEKSSANRSSNRSSLFQNSSNSLSSPSRSKTSGMLHAEKVDESLMDTSTYPDMTYTSILDGTLLNRLHQIANPDHTLSSTFTEDLSKLGVDQLHGRLEHLERVNLTLREEIGVYEAIFRSQGTQVSPSFLTQDTSTTASSGEANHSSDDDILKQHLVEIRKLRQRLERLDITKDPEQLLIFQSHTQQRIARQESMLAHVQQQLVEKEEQHVRDCAQLQHRLARDKAALGEHLEQVIADLRRQLEAQAVELREREQQLQEVKNQLLEGEERDQRQSDELKRVQSEKAELEEDLVKRDKEFLEMEKMMFRLEMAKESVDSDCKRIESDFEEKDKECGKLKKEVDEYKENTKCLKEIIVKREKSLQEKVHSLQKLTNERAAVEQHAYEKEKQVKRLEEDLNNLRKEVLETRVKHDHEKDGLQCEMERLRSDLRQKESMEERNALEKAGYEAEVSRLTEEKVKMRADHERETDRERIEARRQIEDLKSQLRDKHELESELEMLRDKVKIISELQYKVERLESKLDYKAGVETELREKLDSLNNVQSEAKSLQGDLERAEDNLRFAEEEKQKLLQELKEREEKLKKRDKQLKTLISQHMKLDTTFSKLKNVVKEKTEQIHSQKKQLRLFEVSLTASSQEEKDDIMKQLLKELIATQRQVEELLSRLEQNPFTHNAGTVRVETYGMGSTTTSNSGMTTTVTTTSGPGSSASSGQDNVDTVLSVGVKEGSPEKYLGSLSPSLSDGELDARPSSVVGSHTTGISTASSSHTSPLRPVSTNLSLAPTSNYSLSPRHLRYYADAESEIPSGAMPKYMVGSDIRSLVAVLKLESHEKLRKESSEGLVILSSVEARLEDRLKTYKAMNVSESLEYSTLRETSLSCRNLRMCLEEAVKLAASAWITELPPVDARGHFYDPLLAEQNETLKRDLTLLRSRYDMLDHTVKEQQGRLQATNERHKNWEQSLYKQLHKTAQDMEKAKENFDAAGLVPKRSQSLRLRSPNKSPLKRLDDTA